LVLDVGICARLNQRTPDSGIAARMKRGIPVVVLGVHIRPCLGERFNRLWKIARWIGAWPSIRRAMTSAPARVSKATASGSWLYAAVDSLVIARRGIKACFSEVP
jgi:hypothetical protein